MLYDLGGNISKSLLKLRQHQKITKDTCYRNAAAIRTFCKEMYTRRPGSLTPQIKNKNSHNNIVSLWADILKAVKKQQWLRTIDQFP